MPSGTPSTARAFEVTTISGETLRLEDVDDEDIEDLATRVNQASTILDKVVEWVGADPPGREQLPAGPEVVEPPSGET